MGLDSMNLTNLDCSRIVVSSMRSVKMDYIIPNIPLDSQVVFYAPKMYTTPNITSLCPMEYTVDEGDLTSPPVLPNLLENDIDGSIYNEDHISPHLRCGFVRPPRIRVNNWSSTDSMDFDRVFSLDFSKLEMTQKPSAKKRRWIKRVLWRQK